MKFKAAFKKIFEKGNLGLGWFVFWRIALVMIPVMVISRLIAEQAGPNPVAGIAALFFLPVGGNVYLIPIAIPLVLFLWHWVGRMAMRKRLGVAPRGFIGWALYWRVLLLAWAGLLVLGLVLAPLVALGPLLGQGGGDRGPIILASIAGVIGLPGLIYWQLNVIGFVVKNVAAKAEAVPAEAVAPGKGRGPIRDYRALFDASQYGMNWMIAGAYVAAGLAMMLVLPLVRGLFSGDFHFPSVGGWFVVLISTMITGAALAILLHRVKHAWQVIALFAAVMVATAVSIETPLYRAFGAGAAEEPFFDTMNSALRLSFAVFFCSGLLAGIRFGTASILGFILGIGAGQVIHQVLLLPLILSAYLGIDAEFYWEPASFAARVLQTAIDATITGAALWWACDWHLGRRGLRLTQQGAIVARA